MPAVEILFARFQEHMKQYNWERWLGKIPSRHHRSILKYRRWEDQHLHLFGKLLLQEGATKKGYDFALESYQSDIHERPFCYGPIDFNISHAANIAVCAVASEVRLGIDIEKVDEIDLSPFASYMSAEEWRCITSSSHPCRTFLNYWTIKESVMKADGRGMKVPLMHIKVKQKFATLDNRQWWLYPVAVHPDYICHLATDRADTELSVHEVIFD